MTTMLEELLQRLFKCKGQPVDMQQRGKESRYSCPADYAGYLESLRFVFLIHQPSCSGIATVWRQFPKELL
jgi:hypothetical protein